MQTTSGGNVLTTGGNATGFCITTGNLSTTKRWNFCPNCAEKIGETWKYCAGCGQAIAVRPGRTHGRSYPGQFESVSKPAAISVCRRCRCRLTRHAATGACCAFDGLPMVFAILTLMPEMLGAAVDVVIPIPFVR